MIGEYIRTEDGIFKIIKLDIGQRIVFVKGDKGISYNYPKGEFLKYKHSKNIIDLIEEWDYVNGYRVDKIILQSKDEICFKYQYSIDYNDVFTLKKQDIKTILTKELFEANCYKVKEE